jgi:DNA replication protein DnaC
MNSKVPVSKWFDIIGDKTMAGAIFDRIVHQSHWVELKGESIRKKVRIRVA